MRDPRWQFAIPGMGEFCIEWVGWHVHRQCVLGGIPRESLLLVLRNVFANAWKHGAIDWNDRKVEVRLALEAANGALCLTCRNRVPQERVRDRVFLRYVRDDGGMPLLLQPFRSVPSPKEREGKEKAGDGLGLFTVARTVERTGGAIELVGPRLEPWPDQGRPVDFVVGLLFNKVT